MGINEHTVWVPNDYAGSRTDTAVLLVGTATEFDIDQRDIASTHGGFWITEALADILADDDSDDDSGETPEAPEPPTKTSGKTAAKKTSQEGEKA